MVNNLQTKDGQVVFDFGEEANQDEVLRQIERVGASPSTEPSQPEVPEQVPTESQAVEEEQQSPETDLPSLEELDLIEDLGVEEQKVDYATPEAKKLDEDLRKVLGYGLEDIAQGAKALKQVQEHFQKIQAQQAVTETKQVLTQVWNVSGSELDARIDQVIDRFEKYPKEMQARLDNLEGIKLIWAKIEQENAAKRAKTPTFLSSKGQQASGAKKQLTRQEIAKMSQAEYESRQDEIMQFYLSDRR